MMLTPLSKITKNYLIVQLKCVNFMVYKLCQNKGEVHKGMEHVNSGMGCARGILHMQTA